MGSKLRPLGQTDNATGVWGRGEALLVVVAYSVLCKYTHNYIDIYIYIYSYIYRCYIYIYIYMTYKLVYSSIISIKLTSGNPKKYEGWVDTSNIDCTNATTAAMKHASKSDLFRTDGWFQIICSTKFWDDLIFQICFK